MKLTSIDDAIKQWATPRQSEFIDAFNKHKTIKKASESLGISRQTLENGIKLATQRAALQGYSPSHDMTHLVPPPVWCKRGINLLQQRRQAFRSVGKECHQ